MGYPAVKQPDFTTEYFSGLDTLSGEVETSEYQPVIPVIDFSAMDPAELNRGLSDQKWRLNHLYTIRNKQGKRTRFVMNKAQEELFQGLWYLNVILKARQLGFSTFIDLFILDTCLWNKDYKAGIIAHHQDDAKAIFTEKIRFPYENLDPIIRAMVPKGHKDREGEYQFDNGSSVRVSTSFRSGTLQFLHVSEYGKIAAKYPEKAKEIKTGAFEAVAQGQMIAVESTAEGREGEFYDLCERARKLLDAGKKLRKLDFKFHFYPWHENPDYRADPSGLLLTEEMESYFHSLEGRNIHLDDEQKAWYIIKRGTLGEDMFREHPSYPEEAFQAAVVGAYYAKQITDARRQGRITKVPYDKAYPVFSFWDLGIGSNDQMAIWCYQLVGVQGRLINYYQSDGEGIEHYADWLRATGYSFMHHYLPHDARKREIGAKARTIKESAEIQGIRPITVVPRPVTNDEVQAQIQQVRVFLSTVWIDEEKCDQGIKCLENYRREWDEKLGGFKNRAMHNWASHGADSLRTGAVGFEPFDEPAPDDLLPDYYEDL